MPRFFLLVGGEALGEVGYLDDDIRSRSMQDRVYLCIVAEKKPVKKLGCANEDACKEPVMTILVVLALKRRKL